MPYSGYPTPDDFEGDATFVCIPIVVPNKTEFKAAIYGLYAQMTNTWFWRDFGTMSPQDAADLASRGLAQTNAYGDCGGIMACEDVADCIETSEPVQTAITTNENILISQLMTIANSGLQYPSVNSATDTINTIDGAIGADKNDDIKTLINCDLDALWAGIRDGIVARLDDNARSVLEWLVSKADVAERGTALVGAIPIFGSMAKAVLEQMVQLAPDMLNLFEAYSSIEHMDEIACEIFGIVCSECRYPTFDEVFSYYAAAGITGFNDIDDIVIATATDLLFGSTELAALAFYHTLIAYELLVLLMGSKFYGYAGTDALARMASFGEDFANDNWLLLCDTCNEQFIRWTWDFQTQGSGEFYIDTVPSTSDGEYVAGEGWKATDIGSAVSVRICMALEQSMRIHAAAMQVEHSGFVTNNSSIHLRPTRGSNTGVGTLGLSTGTGGYNRCSQGFAVQKNMQEILFTGTSSPDTSETYIRRVIIVFERDYGKEGVLSSSEVICS